MFASDEPVLWLDADAVIMRPLYPLELQTKSYDFAVFRDEARKGSKHYFRSGTVFFNNTSAAKMFAGHWSARRFRDPEVWDQELLFQAWEANQDHSAVACVSTLFLDETYCKIFDRGDVEDPHIVHYQASRATRKKEHA